MNPELLTLEQVIQVYMQNALAIQADPQLNLQVKSQAMLQMAQALGTLVPLTTNDGQAELQLKAQEHQMNLTVKQEELKMKQQEHQFNLQAAAQKHQLDLETAARKHQTDTVIKTQQAEQKAKQAEAQAQAKAKQNTGGNE